MSDNDDTPPARRGRHRDYAQQPIVGTKQRRRTAVMGVPLAEQLDPDDMPLVSEREEITSPFELLERDLFESERAVIQRSRRNAGDPLTFADGVKLAETLARARREERSSNQERANQLMALLNRPPDEVTAKLQSDVDAIKRSSSIAGWILKTMVVLVLGGLVGLAERIWDRAEHEGETTIRLNHVEDELRRLLDRQGKTP